MSKKLLLLKIIGISFLIPVVLYWGAQIRQFTPNAIWVMEIAKEQRSSSWLICLKLALFPWGLLISGILIPVGVGIIQLKNFWRQVAVAAMCLYIPFIFVLPFLIQHWFFQGTLIYVIFLIIYLTRKSIKGEFNKSNS